MLHIFIPMLLITNTNLSIKCIPTLLNYRISHMRNGYTFTYVRELKWKWKWELLSHVQLFATPWTVHGILQARILEWVAFPFFRGSPTSGIEPRSPTLQADSLPAEPQGKPKNPGVGSLSLLQGIFQTQELNWGLPHCRWILYQLSYQGSLWGN